jgi:hypothetical protein
MSNPQQRFGTVLEGLSQKGVKLRFLLASPDSAICKIRADS